jgi:hypothetical protein
MDNVQNNSRAYCNTLSLEPFRLVFTFVFPIGLQIHDVLHVKNAWMFTSICLHGVVLSVLVINITEYIPSVVAGGLFNYIVYLQRLYNII